MYDIVCIAVLQHPESQNVLVGSNATFLCGIRFNHSSISWKELSPGANELTPLSQDEGNGVYIHEIQISEDEGYNSTLTIVITCSNAERWNGTILWCSAESGGPPLISERATLAIHKSLSKT